MIYMKELGEILQTLKNTNELMSLFRNGKASKKAFMVHCNDRKFRFYYGLVMHCGQELYVIKDGDHYRLGNFKIHKDWVTDKGATKSNPALDFKNVHFAKYNKSFINQVAFTYLKRRRTELGLTQADLSRATGIDHDLLSRYERGLFPISFANMISMACIMQVDLNDFINHVNENCIKPIDDLFKY